jgi:hypothetical protein
MVIVCSFIFAMIVANTTGEEEEDHSEGFEEKDQGHFTDQGKPPLDAYLILIILLLHY